MKEVKMKVEEMSGHQSRDCIGFVASIKIPSEISLATKPGILLR